MKIEILYKDRLENANIIAHVLVVGAHNMDEAVRAIQSTDTDDESLSQGVYILDQRDRLKDRVAELEKELFEQEEKYDVLSSAYANVYDTREFIKHENERLSEENQSLLEDLNTIGNGIDSLSRQLNDTHYVPF